MYRTILVVIFPGFCDVKQQLSTVNSRYNEPAYSGQNLGGHLAFK
jgi:hypothetical protein